ncbi:MAG: STAS domain-containing protein [Hyphomicrobiaceae bacterium]
MKVDILNEDNGVTRMVLAGRMDIEGATATDMQFSIIAGSKKKVIVDLTSVDFMASLGMRTLIMSAKSIASKGGKMVLLAPQPGVEKVLKSSGVDTVIPIAPDLAAATALVG